MSARLPFSRFDTPFPQLTRFSPLGEVGKWASSL